MRPVPRILPIIAVTIGGVLAINALSGVRDLQQRWLHLGQVQR